MDSKLIKEIRETGSKLFTIDKPKEESGKLLCKYPFNLDFDSKIKDKKLLENYKGPGIYAIFFDKKLIYIGKYRTLTSNSNVITVRWVKHIMTLTNRGYRVGGSALKNLFKPLSAKKNKKTIYEDLKKDFQDKNLKNENWLLYTLDKDRSIDTGTVTSLNRLKFANENWEIFQNLSENDIEMLNKFEFSYFQLKSKIEIKGIDFRPYLVDFIEDFLIKEYAPRCNNKGNRSEKTNTKEIKNRIDEILKSFNKPLINS